jgi:phosphoribosyl 1,2-cyclic phosphodiesterase
MVVFCPLASGSRGNSIYLGTDKTKILFDAGISTKAIKERLAEINVDVAELDAIVISHEHHDHIQGLKVLAFKYNIPIIANSATAKAICEHLHDEPKFKIFTTGEAFEFHDLSIHPFSVKHDAIDPVGFAVQTEEMKIGIATDLGFVTKTVMHHLAACQILYLEANHEPSMVHGSSRPPVYKERVLGPTGHLSNEDCGKLITSVFHNDLKEVFLAHLSSECNSPQMALHVVSRVLQENGLTVQLTIAEQDKLTLSKWQSEMAYQ